MGQSLLLVTALASTALLGACASAPDDVARGRPSPEGPAPTGSSAASAAPVLPVAPKECGPPTGGSSTAPDPGEFPSTWGGLSGASGGGAADGTFGKWRGTPLSIAGTWNDSFSAQPLQCTIYPGYEYGDWDADLDIAIGAIYDERGETWAAASAGEYDDRWRTALEVINRVWGTRQGTLYLRFAHEFNITSSPWQVQGSETEQFIAAWRRFRALQRDVLPDAKLIFCPNDGSSSRLSLDWRTAFPGSAYVDGMGVDAYYRDGMATAEDFASWINRTDRLGAPIGIEQHRLFAESVSLPLALPEWGNDGHRGESPAFVRELHGWLTRNAGNGPGQISYEIVFNVGSFDNSRYALFPFTLQPDIAATYVDLF